MNPEFTYVKVRKEHLHDAWIHAMPWIQKALEDVNDAAMDLPVILRQLELGYMQLWAIQDKRKGNQPICFVVTHLIETDGYKVLVVRWCAGVEMHNWLEDLSIIENWAKEQSCQKLEIWGREGWVKVLKKFGYKPEFTVVSKTLSTGVH